MPFLIMCSCLPNSLSHMPSLALPLTLSLSKSLLLDLSLSRWHRCPAPFCCRSGCRRSHCCWQPQDEGNFCFSCCLRASCCRCRRRIRFVRQPLLFICVYNTTKSATLAPCHCPLPIPDMAALCLNIKLVATDSAPASAPSPVPGTATATACTPVQLNFPTFSFQLRLACSTVVGFDCNRRRDVYIYGLLFPYVLGPCFTPSHHRLPPHKFRTIMLISIFCFLLSSS